MDKEDVAYIYIHTHTPTHTMEYYSAIKKNENFAICSNIDRLGGYYAKWNKSDRKSSMKSLICGI